MVVNDALWSLYYSLTIHVQYTNFTSTHCRPHNISFYQTCLFKYFSFFASSSSHLTFSHSHKSNTQSKVTVKLMDKQSLKRLQFRTWGKRIGSSTTASVTLGNTEEKTTIVAYAFSCCGKPPRVLVKQFVLRLKSRWRLWRKSDNNNNIQYSYDLRSYHLNFDDGWSRRW